MLNLLKQDAKVGDSLNLYLTSGNSVKGTIVEIGENYLLMEVDGVKRRYFPQLIGGWDVVNEAPQVESLEVINEQATDVEKNEKEASTEVEEEFNDVLISLFDKIYENEHIDLSASIKTNATVDKVLPTGVSVITDNGEQIICHKGFMAGFSRVNCTSGKRLFCGNVNNTGMHKGICYLSVLQMSFIELRERFVTALSTKPTPRKPIINSIIAYLRNNCNGKSTKKLISDLRNKINLLVKTGKAEDPELEKYISFKQYKKAFELIETKIKSSEDDKQKTALLLRKAQLYSSLKEHENAIAAYRELISFNENMDSPSTYLSHLYTELARLLLLVGDDEQAKNARKNALLLNPNNVVAKKLISNSDIDSDEQSFIVAKYTDERLVDCDIDSYIFTDPEIVSLNGLVTNNIANRLLESSSSSEDFVLHIETAKALKSLPIGSYDIQDLEDSINSYSLYKIRSLFNSYKKVIRESDTIDSISVEQLNRIKDCLICYSFETIEEIVNDDLGTAETILLDSLLLELSSILISQKVNRNTVLEVLNFSLDNFYEFCKRTEEEILAKLFVKLISYSIQCSNLWELLILKSNIFESLITFINNNSVIKQKILDLTPNQNRRNINNPNYIIVLREHVSNRLKESFNKLKKMENTNLNLSSLSHIKTKFMFLLGRKHVWCFNETDKKSLEDINHLVSLLSLYQISSKEERKNIITNALLEIDKVIRWNSSNMTTTLGRFYFYPLLVSWKETLTKHNSQDEYNANCLLSVETDSPYYSGNRDKEKSFNVVLYNKSNLISEGFRLAIWIGDNPKNGLIKTDDKYILPNSSVPLEIRIPYEKWGNLDIYELNFAISSKYLGKWSTTEFASATISRKRDITFKKGEQKWHDSGNPPIEMFKGRDGIVNELKEHYCSLNRRYSYVLYGLSRTGKSSILDYLKRAIEGVEIEGVNSQKVVLPLYIDLGAIYGLVNSSDKFWKLFLKTIYKDTENFIEKFKPGVIVEKTDDFSQFILALEGFNIHPLFMLDEFSYMQDIIDAGYINSAFLQYMRTISADKDLASFIFAGTYDIKYLIHDPKYNISGAFTYLREPDKPLFEISADAAEELINMMQGQLDFSPAAIREIHRLTGDVPFWIQKLCLNCAFYGVDNNKPDIGIQDLEAVVCKMTGEPNKTSYDMSSIPSLNEGTFSKTQILDTDSEEIKIVLTSISFLMKEADSQEGVTYEQIKALWSDNNTDISNYDIKEALDSLCERKTLTFEDIDNMRFYKFSIDLFRRWWLHEHFVFELQLSSFKKIARNEHLPL